MIKGIAGYTAKTQNGGVLLGRSYAGITDTFAAKDFDAVAEWLTEEYPNSFHIAWNLADFADAIFSLLPADKQTELKQKSRVYIGNIKIFSVDRWLGITAPKHIKGNFFEPRENNFFGISQWLPSGTPEPADASELAQLGESVVVGLERMGIRPDKLTSPVGVYSDQLASYDLPTIYSNEDIIDASEYCIPMMRHEWRSAYKIGYFEKAYAYDLTAAYSHFMSNLPDTDKCTIKFSDQWHKADWGICKATIEITSDISPIVYNTGEGHILPKGPWGDFFTTEELLWIHNHHIGKVTFIDGYFFKWLTTRKPYWIPMHKLFGIRQTNDGMVSNIARRMAQGISGKLDQDNKDGSLGELYNPVLAAITRSRCRLAVADFLWDNSLLDSLIAVQVDGPLLDKEVGLTDGDNGIGSWRFEGMSPALVLGKGEVWLPNKRPLNLGFDEVVDSMKKNPQKSYYEFGQKFIDLKAMAVDLDREYDRFPTTGLEALTSISNSKPIKIDG